ncbi:ASCH domain-containing protein [Paracoccus litorisediminis]|nr:ASCH domain-containing protein [Paracoccus litorisediminis]
MSIWNPFASLIVKGFKLYETRTWAAPKSLIGQRIGIASTKCIQPGQRAHFDDPEFQRFYERLGLPDKLTDMPNGYMLGSAILEGVELMTPEFMAEVSDEEQAYGWWQEGFYAWRMTDPVEFEKPVQVKGAQGIWNWSAPDGIEAKGRQAPHPSQSADLRWGVRPA